MRINIITTKNTFIFLLGLIASVPFLAVAANGELAPNPDSLPDSESYTFKVVDDISLRLHVFDSSTTATEAITKPRPAIVFFFGGGLRGGSVMQFFSQAKALSELGMVAVIADYRVYRRHKTGAIEAVTDAQSAIRWVREHAEDLAVDPNRIVAAGGSSGGYLAAATATMEAVGGADSEASGVSTRANAAALFNPALANRFPNVEAELSPYHQLDTNAVPTFIVHGKQDKVVAFASAQAYCDRIHELQAYCELHAYETAGHGFFNRNRNDGEWYRETFAQLQTFLQKFGYLD